MRLNDVERSILTVLILLFIIIWILFLIYQYIISWRFHNLTRSPRYLDWMTNPETPNYVRKDYSHFTIYTKPYTIKMSTTVHGKTNEQPKWAIEMIRTLLRNHFGIRVSSTMVPDSTCIVSIPCKNFKSGSKPGEFQSINPGPPESFYEYRMIGDNRMQVAYYNVGGVRYVAGVCIYFKDPYQSKLHYRAFLIPILLNKPVFWSKYNLKEEKMTILVRRNTREVTLLTENRYGQTGHYRLQRQKRVLEPRRLLHMYCYESFDSLEISALKPHFCEAENKLVAIAKWNEKNVHAIWNLKEMLIEYMECESCACSDFDSPPPAYQSVEKNKTAKLLNS